MKKNNISQPKVDDISQTKALATYMYKGCSVNLIASLPRESNNSGVVKH